MPNAYGTINAVALQADGKIVAVGMSISQDWLIMRFNADGSPDTSFSTDGWTTLGITNLEFCDTARAVSRPPGRENSGRRFDGWRIGDRCGAFQPEWNTRHYFHGGGIPKEAISQCLIRTDFMSSTEWLFCRTVKSCSSAKPAFIKRPPLEKCGRLEIWQTERLIRLRRQRQLARAELPVQATTARARQSPLAGRKSRYRGHRRQPSRHRAAAAERRARHLCQQSKASQNRIQAIRREQRGARRCHAAGRKIVIAGRWVETFGNGATKSEFGVARLQSNGTLDAAFSGDGVTTIDFTPHTDDAHAVLIQPDGKIVAGGFADFSDNTV
jgi:uncharacterized delta-60 repeat protein